jgi:hypothetical protein
MELGIEAEKFTEREKKIRALLKEYRTIDRRIEYFERLAKGDGLVHQPSVTAAPPIEDDAWLLVQRATEPLSEAQEHMVSVVQKYLSPSGFTYATCARVANALSTIVSDDQDEDELLQMMFGMLREASSAEERVELTDTERLAILREREINQARQKLATLREHKRHVGYALDTMREYYHEDYLLLWNRDVLCESVKDVCDAVGISFMTELETYKKRMRRAREEFARWVPNHIVQ